MKRIIFISAITSLFMLISCDDYLQRKPLEFGSDVNYYYTVQDLRKGANKFYELFPGNNTPDKDGLFTYDNNSDNQMGGWANNDFYPGSKLTPDKDNSDWKFDNIRKVNYLITLTEQRFERGELIGDEKDINHCLGEFYFFRAFDYFRLLTKIGDAPILRLELGDNFEELVRLSTRQPRNEVARFIIEDLEKAKSLLEETSPEAGRINRDCARMMIARVGLFEATWEKYHAGTVFVPGNPKWIGNKTHPNFTFKSGSLENEINFFLDKAIVNAKEVADARDLTTDYESMFNRTNTHTFEEMILVKKYIKGVVAHSVPKLLAAGSNNCGYTQALVETFLMKDGSPIYTSDAYINERRDTALTTEMKDRDIRLVTSVKHINYYPAIINTTETGSPTGYDIRKYYVTDPEQTGGFGAGITDTPIFRAAEAYLIYMEAYYERHKTLDGSCDTYWKKLRRRAGVDENYRHTIDLTDLDKENDLAVWSKGIKVDKVLYNIRRERRCEFIAEGFRLDDLHRWRALDMMNAQGDKYPIGDGYVMRGFNLWDQAYVNYDRSKLKDGVVSSENDGPRISPQRRSITDIAYEGYNFPKPHYLQAIPISDIIMNSQNSDASTSTIYQNPGWPSQSVGPADPNYDCD